MPRTNKDVQKGLIFLNNPFRMVGGSIFRCREEGLLSPGSQLLPYSVVSSNTLLPSVVGSPPAFQHPVPVVSGYNSLLPVDVTNLNIFFSVFLFLELIFQVGMVKSTLAALLVSLNFVFFRCRDVLTCFTHHFNVFCMTMNL